MRAPIALPIVIFVAASRLAACGPSQTAHDTYLNAQAGQVQAEAENLHVKSENERLNGDQARGFAADWHDLWVNFGWAASYSGLALGVVGGAGLVVGKFMGMMAAQRIRRDNARAELLRAEAERERDRRLTLAWMRAQRDRPPPAAEKLLRAGIPQDARPQRGYRVPVTIIEVEPGGDQTV